jgi:beta-mannosidase
LPDFAGLSLRIEGACGESKFDLTRPINFSAGNWEFSLENPKLWWPAGYGEQNLYEISLSLWKDGAPLCETSFSMGIRTVELRRTELTTPEHPGEFVFLVNGVKIFCKGSNWVPLDALHREDPARYEPALALFRDTHCNMLRCWGGNVYEDDRFYELCDQYGILVWQDFSMACGIYPQTQEYEYAREAETIVRKLRQHPCIALWSGDNECDQSWRGRGLDPNDNLLTRKVLPEAVSRCDGARPYLPSSPYLGPEAVRRDLCGRVSEAHLWGPRDYFKSEFYLNAPCHFVSEIGYHGCPNRSSIERFIPRESLWPWEDNPDWLLHSSEPTGRPDGPYAYRNKLMANQIAQFFGAHAQTLGDFILLSQITQAEAFKFFIEHARAGKWRKTGVLWWNMLDGWPQFSDAVVDWYFGKKLAYWYIRRSQAHLCLLVTEPRDWHARLLACNDTLQTRRGAYRLWDADTGETLLSGDFTAPRGENAELGRLRVESATHRLLLMEWESGGERGVNHYLLGKPPFDPARYRAWLGQIAALDGSFDARQVGG